MAHLVLSHLLAQHVLGDDALVQALAQQAEEEAGPIAVRRRVRAWPSYAFSRLDAGLYVNSVARAAGLWPAQACGSASSGIAPQ